jgi:hypothetical protein
MVPKKPDSSSPSACEQIAVLTLCQPIARNTNFLSLEASLCVSFAVQRADLLLAGSFSLRIAMSLGPSAAAGLLKST